MTSNKKNMDAEYNAMRRRMSRLRVGQKASLEAEDVACGGDDPGFKDLIKYWKRHGIPVPKDLISDMSDEKVNQAVAKSKGRRRSRELEDLHFCASTGKFNLEKLSIPEDEDMKHTPQKRSVGVASKTKGGSLKKTPSRSIVTNSNPQKKLLRTQSNYK